MTDRLLTREVSVPTWKPQTFDDQSLSVHAVAVTENPVRVWDFETSRFIHEVLLLSGLILPETGQVPLLDSHNRQSVTGILGSARNFSQVNGVLECDVFFANTDAGRTVAMNVKDGHLTDFSVGYIIDEAVYLADGEVRELDGRTFEGPLKVTTRWHLRELSVTAIGADQKAKSRSLNDDAPLAETAGGEDVTVPPATPPPPKSAGSEAAGERAEASAVRQAAAPPAGGEDRFIDILFFAFVAVMILFIIKGLF